jgi:predicted HTH domain antitoxin
MGDPSGQWWFDPSGGFLRPPFSNPIQIPPVEMNKDKRGNQRLACYVESNMQVTVELPDQVARQWGETPDAVGRHVLEDVAIEGYRTGRLSHRQAGQMLGLDYWQTETFLKEKGVPLNYTAADLEADNATLAGILAHS